MNQNTHQEQTNKNMELIQSHQEQKTHTTNQQRIEYKENMKWTNNAFNANNKAENESPCIKNKTTHKMNQTLFKSTTNTWNEFKKRMKQPRIKRAPKTTNNAKWIQNISTIETT